jgi:putative aldouronate transport system substrate-binding protein
MQYRRFINIDLKVFFKNNEIILEKESRTMRKMSILMLCVLLALMAMLGGCGSREERTDSTEQTTTKPTTAPTTTEPEEEYSIVTPAGQYPIVNEPVTLTILLQSHNNVIDFNTNECTLWYEEKTGVDLEFNEVPDIGQVIHLMLSSGDYPDIIVPYFQGYDFVNYGTNQGIFLPINPYMEKYGENINRILEEFPYVAVDITAPDGNIYGMPEINEVYHGRLPVKGWVNSSWLRALNMAPPETTEDFYRMLKAFKEMDPNSNNKEDEIPMTGTGVKSQNPNVVAFIMSAFIVDDQSNHWVQPYVEGELDVIFNKPEYKEGLAFINKLYSEGLIDQEFATQDDSTLRAKVETGLVGFVATLAPQHFLTLSSERSKDFDHLLPIEGPSGMRTTFRSPFQSRIRVVITDNCQYPEVAFRLLDGMLTEEFTNRWELGEEGVHWRKGEPGEFGTNGKPALWKRLVSFREPHNVIWAQRGLGFRPIDWREGEVAEQDIYSEAGSGARIFKATQDMEPFNTLHDLQIVPSTFWFSAELTAEVAQLKTTILDYVHESTARFITGDLNLDSDWDAYIQTLNKMGLERYIQLHQDALLKK